MVTEFVPKTLLAVLHETSYSPSRFCTLSTQLVSALCYIHSLQICHRDIKPPNILVTTDDVIKICDLGLSRVAPLGLTKTLTVGAGTPLFMPPEALAPKGQGRYDAEKWDVYSLGVVLWIMWYRRVP